MNLDLDHLHSYPFQKLATLLQDTKPPATLKPINLYIGEPKHPTPDFIRQALIDNMGGLAVYPTTLGGEQLRIAIAEWIKRRHSVKQIDYQTQIIPVNGSREALFAFAQAVVDRTRADPAVIMPNPFYQIYEGAAMLSGAEPHYMHSLLSSNYAFDTDQLPESVWKRTQLVITCSPDNPTGHVMTLDEWRNLFELSDRYGFVIASDECYSEIYFDESNPPLGAMRAAQELGRDGYPRLVIFSSLSKRSNVPGMRSGFVAGDADILKKFLLYRTYHGCAMSPPVHVASAAAWNDEAHVAENRRLYREKFASAIAILKPVITVGMPQAAFYLWMDVGCDDVEFTRSLYEKQNVSVLPGSYMGREARGINPGKNHVRIALVSTTAECTESAQRIADFIQHH